MIKVMYSRSHPITDVSKEKGQSSSTPPRDWKETFAYASTRCSQNIVPLFGNYVVY
jgi:hypothetical protein